VNAPPFPHDPPDLLLDEVLLLEKRRRRDLREEIDRVGRLPPFDSIEHLRIADGVSDAKAGDPVRLRERSEENYVSVSFEKRRQIGVGKLAIRLIDQDEAAYGTGDAVRLIKSERPTGRVVRRRQKDELRSMTARGVDDRLCWPAEILVHRDVDDGAAGQAGGDMGDGVGGGRDQHRPPLLQSDEGCRVDQLVRTVADEHPVRGDPRAPREGGGELFGRVWRIARPALARSGGGDLSFQPRRKLDGRFVLVQLDRVRRVGDAVRPEPRRLAPEGR